MGLINVFPDRTKEAMGLINAFLDRTHEAHGHSKEAHRPRSRPRGMRESVVRSKARGSWASSTRSPIALTRPMGTRVRSSADFMDPIEAALDPAKQPRTAADVLSIQQVSEELGGE